MRDEASVLLLDRLEPDRILGPAAVRQTDLVPAVVADIECPADVDHVHAEAFDDAILRLRHLLADIVDPGVPTSNIKMFLEIVVGDRRNAGTWRRTKVEGDTVWFLVIDAREDSFPRSHGCAPMQSKSGCSFDDRHTRCHNTTGQSPLLFLVCGGNRDVMADAHVDS